MKKDSGPVGKVSESFPLAHLSLIASRLLNVLLVLGEEWVNVRPKKEIALLCGTGREQSLIQARHELEAAGLLSVEKRHKQQPLLHLRRDTLGEMSSSAQNVGLSEMLDKSVSKDRLSIHTYVKGQEMALQADSQKRGDFRLTESVSQGSETALQAASLDQQKVLVNENPSKNESQLTESVSQEPFRLTESVSQDLPDQQKVLVKNSQLTESVSQEKLDQQKVLVKTGRLTESVVSTADISVTDTTESGSQGVSLLDRCMEVDAMDGSGDITLRNSPAQKRRKAQLPLVVELWNHFIPEGGELVLANQKQFLAWCENSLETLYEQLELVAAQIRYNRGVKHPLQYSKVVLEGNARKRVVSSSAHPAGESGELAEPSQAFLLRRAQAQQHFEQWRQKAGLPE